MTDRRTYFANERVAHESAIEPLVDQEVKPTEIRQCTAPTADVCESASGARDTQLLFGEKFEVLETLSGWSFGRSLSDDYVGYVNASSLAEPNHSTHVVSMRSTHLYPMPNIKQKELLSLSMGSEIAVEQLDGNFTRLVSGEFIPKQHIRPIQDVGLDFALFAEYLLGTPYLWGGSSSFGIDCSGLVQLSLKMCGLPCPRDSDQQMSLGESILGVESLQRGDLVFWKGHVGLLLDAERIIHANAFHMAVAVEPFATAKQRIGENEFGEIIDIRRLGH